MKKNIKLVIFDFDDTLYEGENWQNWDKYIKKMTYSFYDNKEQCEEFAKKYKIFEGCTNQYMAKCLTNEFGSTQKLVDFMSNVLYELDVENLKVIENDFLAKLSKKAKLAIVSNSSKNYLHHYLKRFNIDESLFEYILQNEYDVNNYTKGLKYTFLINQLNLKPDEILVVGDNYITDIAPALELGINAVHTSNLADVKNAVNMFIKF